MPNYKVNTLVLIATLSLTGCGLKGPLFFPEKASPSSGQKSNEQSTPDEKTATTTTSSNNH